MTLAAAFVLLLVLYVAAGAAFAVAFVSLGIARIDPVAKDATWGFRLIQDPDIDYAALGRSMGVEAEGPIADAAALGPAIARGIRAVKAGRPYRIDMVTQSR